jgi:hypothetical protein
MIEYFFSFTQHEFVFIIAYLAVIIAGIYVSLKHNVQPILTLVLILGGTIIYLIVTNIAKGHLPMILSDGGFPANPIVLIGFSGILVSLKMFRNLLRIPFVIIHSLLVQVLIFFSFFQVGEYLKDSPYILYEIFSFPLYEIAGPLQTDHMQLSATLLPEIFIQHGFLFEVLTMILVTLTFVFFTARFKLPGNTILFAIVILMVLVFISLFKVYPPELPVISDRLMGLNVVQWGLTLICVLLSAHIMSSEMSATGRKKEVLKKMPSEYALLVIYLFLTMVSFQVNSLFSKYEIKILLACYFITSGFMAVFIFNRIEKHYLRYGTVSIILVTCILFTHANIAISGPVEFIETDNTINPQTHLDQSLIREDEKAILSAAVKQSSFPDLNKPDEPRVWISGPIETLQFNNTFSQVLLKDIP